MKEIKTEVIDTTDYIAQLVDWRRTSFTVEAQKTNHVHRSRSHDPLS
jgi:hypothetical protein